MVVLCWLFKTELFVGNTFCGFKTIEIGSVWFLKAITADSRSLSYSWSKGNEFANLSKILGKLLSFWRYTAKNFTAMDKEPPF
jgi:hypothetical protein